MPFTMTIQGPRFLLYLQGSLLGTTICRHCIRDIIGYYLQQGRAGQGILPLYLPVFRGNRADGLPRVKVCDSSSILWGASSLLPGTYMFTCLPDLSPSHALVGLCGCVFRASSRTAAHWTMQTHAIYVRLRYAGKP